MGDRKQSILWQGQPLYRLLILSLKFTIAMSTNRPHPPSSPSPSPLCFCFCGCFLEAQTIEADDPTAESPISPPPAARNHLLPIAGAQAARLRPFLSLPLLTGNEPPSTPRYSPQPPRPPSGRFKDSSLAPPLCWAPLCSRKAGRGWCPGPREALLGGEPCCDLSRSAELPCLDADSEEQLASRF